MKKINYLFYVFVFFALAVGVIIIALLKKLSFSTNKTFPLFTAKTLFLCQKFISDVMFELPRLLPVALALAIGVVLGIGLLSFLLQLTRTHLLLRKLFRKKVEIPKDLVKVMATLGLSDKIILVNDHSLFSFCGGLFSPYIVVTTALVQSLTKKELEAVLLHEQSHLLNRDPLKILVGKTFSSMFFFLPIFQELHKNIEAINELLADQWTINRQQESTYLRQALKKILAAPQLNLNVVANVSGPDFLEIRIHRLVNPERKHQFRLSLVSMITTILFFVISWFWLQTPVSAFHMDSGADSTSFPCSIDHSCFNQCRYDFKKSIHTPAYSFCHVISQLSQNLNPQLS